MRTLIRASQLHSDISGLVKIYGDNFYPNYRYLTGVSGIKSFTIGDTLYFAIDSNNGEFVKNLAGLTGAINVVGESGLYTRSLNNSIYFGYSGVGGNGVTQSITGYGNIDVWKSSPSGYAVSGISITGSNGIETSYNPNKTLLTIRGAGIGKLNNSTGNLVLVGRNGTQVSVSGQSIYIDAYQAAASGVHSLNNLKGNPISIIGTSEINIDTITGLNSIFIGYTGRGWGQNQLFNGDNTSVHYIGDENIFNNNLSLFVDGDKNTLQQNTGVSTINAAQSNFLKNYDSSFINVTGSTFVEVTGSTFINGTANNGTFAHPYATAFGGSVDNTFTTNLFMKCFLSGKELMKPLKVPKTTYSGLYIQTGTILFGEINYAAVRYDMTDFEASFDVKGHGIYGKKHFTVQRATNLQIDIKDESDLFGGSNKYNLFISGGNDQCLYLWGSGYSGNNPDDGLDGVHDVIFMANVNFVNFSVTPQVD